MQFKTRRMKTETRVKFTNGTEGVLLGKGKDFSEIIDPTGTVKVISNEYIDFESMTVIEIAETLAELVKILIKRIKSWRNK